MADRSSQCTEFFAKVLTRILTGDSEMSVKDSAGNPVPLYSYFCTLTMDDAREAYEQIYELPEHARPRDFIERLGLDGRVAAP